MKRAPLRTHWRTVHSGWCELLICSDCGRVCGKVRPSDGSTSLPWFWEAVHPSFIACDTAPTLAQAKQAARANLRRLVLEEDAYQARLNGIESP